MSTDLLHSVTHQLTEADEGYWVGEVAGAISYPDGRSQACADAEEGENTGWFDHRANVLAMTLKAFPPGGTMLDVGGGNGFVTRALQAGGHDVALLEPDPTAVARARASGVPPVVHATPRCGRRASHPAACRRSGFSTCSSTFMTPSPTCTTSGRC